MLDFLHNLNFKNSFISVGKNSSPAIKSEITPNNSIRSPSKQIESPSSKSTSSIKTTTLSKAKNGSISSSSTVLKNASKKVVGKVTNNTVTKVDSIPSSVKTEASLVVTSDANTTVMTELEGMNTSTKILQESPSSVQALVISQEEESELDNAINAQQNSHENSHENGQNGHQNDHINGNTNVLPKNSTSEVDEIIPKNTKIMNSYEAYVAASAAVLAVVSSPSSSSTKLKLKPSPPSSTNKLDSLNNNTDNKTATDFNLDDFKGKNQQIDVLMKFKFDLLLRLRFGWLANHFV